MAQSRGREIVRFSIFYIYLVSHRNTEFSESTQCTLKAFLLVIVSQPERMGATEIPDRDLGFIKD